MAPASGSRRGLPTRSSSLRRDQASFITAHVLKSMVARAADASMQVTAPPPEGILYDPNSPRPRRRSSWTAAGTRFLPPLLQGRRRAAGFSISTSPARLNIVICSDRRPPNLVAEHSRVILFNNAAVYSSSVRCDHWIEAMGANAIAFIKTRGIRESRLCSASRNSAALASGIACRPLSWYGAWCSSVPDERRPAMGALTPEAERSSAPPTRARGDLAEGPLHRIAKPASAAVNLRRFLRRQRKPQIPR